jgi:hypothetical protein
LGDVEPLGEGDLSLLAGEAELAEAEALEFGVGFALDLLAFFF